MAKRHGSIEAKTAINCLISSALSPTGPAVVGLVVNERFVNLPPSLVPRLHTAVMLDDVQWSLQTQTMDEEERPFYKYTHLLFFSSCYQTSEDTPESSPSTTKSMLGFNAMFRHFEEELYLQQSLHQFAYPTGRKERFESSAESVGGKRKRSGKTKKSEKNYEQCLEYRVVMVVPFDAVKRITREIDLIVPPTATK
eukprot:GHVS01080929.1.p1 GENE.GHVS01080929.1~~GHVS01080929.1.p1  ORF type:complete len:196 (-),score=30.52 GHVS01080929.1:255-842(-)